MNKMRNASDVLSKTWGGFHKYHCKTIKRETLENVFPKGIPAAMTINGGLLTIQEIRRGTYRAEYRAN